MRNRVSCLVMILLLAFVLPLGAQNESVDWQMVNKIKTEGFDNSKVMEIAWYLTEVHGPRLTGSPQLKSAMEWSRDKLNEWGLANAKLEPWGAFGRGWTTEGFSLEMVEPTYMNIIAHPKAWTPGTDGAITAAPVLLSIESEEDFAKYQGKLKGAIVMVRAPEVPETPFEALASRYTDEKLAELAQSPEPRGQLDEDMRERIARWRARRALMQRVAKFMNDEGVQMVLEPSERNYGIVRVASGGSREMDGEPTLPQMVVAIEQYNRIARLVEKGIPVKLRANATNRFFTDDSLGYNVVAEIPGVDKKLKPELVMLGAHLDSWHSGTGATDNAAGSAVMLEVVRILKAINVQPKRTIRIALWTGEEQGLLGSRAYVENHFGNRRTMELKPAHANFSGYFNLDNGTGKIRGVYLQGNDAVRPVFEAWLKPFHDLGATTLTIRNTGGTDHLAFDAVGLPGFQFIQDPIEYGTRTHHTNVDTYDHLQPADLKQAAVIIASFVYHTAMRDEKLPRKPLPRPEQSPTTP